MNDNNNGFQNVDNVITTIRDRSGRRKRTFELEDIEHLRSAKQSRPEFWQSSIAPIENNLNINNFKKINFFRLLSHRLRLPDCQWIGYNSKIFKDESAIQKIEYLLQINDSPTNPDVGKETSRRSLQIASECGKTYYNVTYDLTMAKIARRIQSSGDEFLKLFIHFGCFHTMMSYHKAMGKCIEGSGLVNLLIDSGILAHGSVNTLLGAKNFTLYYLLRWKFCTLKDS